jgi:hypothetical protein
MGKLADAVEGILGDLAATGFGKALAELTGNAFPLA